VTETVLVPADQDGLDDFFGDNGWSDGLPIVAPTRERVDRFLAAISWPADRVIGEMPPANGEITVEGLAVNSVMAGCRPEYLPVVIAAVTAMLEPEFNLFAVQSTTHPASPLIIVNGPVVDQLGMNSRYGAFGPGCRANATIGRAARLALLNIGGAAPGVLDRSTQGQSSKYSFCVAENELESPWEPLSIERGFGPEASTVTVVGAENPHNLNDHGSTTGEGVLATFSGAMNDLGANNAYRGGEPVLAVGPEHAAILAADGYGKAEIRQHIFDHARIPRALWNHGGRPEMAPDWFPDEEQVPIIAEPDSLLVIVLGGFGRHSAWLPTFGEATRSVTVRIPRSE